MKKRLLVMLGIGALCLGASAKEVNNYLKDGFPVLVPGVQKLERTGEGFRLPLDLAVAAPAEAKYEAGLVGKTIAGRFGGYKAHVVGADEAAKCRFILTGEGVPKSPEGYTLEISPRGIEIRARSTSGLFYGAQTLCSIIRNNIVTALPGCRITDFPDLKIRGAFLNIRHLKNSEAAGFANTIRLFGELKYNTLVLEFAENLPMKDNPFTLRKETLTQESLDTILAAAKRNHIEIIPHLQVLSHDTWMRMHPEHKEKVSARKDNTSSRLWDSSACPEKPLTRELTDYTINETIRLLKPKKFHLGMDEFILCEWNKCNMCPNGHNAEQLAREAKHYTELVDKQGVTPYVYHDSLCGRDGSGGEKALPHLPKSVVFNMWSYRAEPTVEYFDFFHEKGFKTVGVSYVHVPANIPAIARAAKKYKTEGAILTYWGYLRDFLSPTGIDTLSASGTVTAAEYQWKTAGPDIQSLDYDPAWELRRRLGIIRTPWRRPKSRYVGIPVAEVCNAKLGQDRNFPLLNAEKIALLAKELAGTPEGFKLNVTPDGRIAAAVLSGGKKDKYATGRIVIPVNGRLHGLSFLMTASRPYHEAKLDAGYRLFPEAAVLKVNYADGKSRRVPVRYNMEINDWNSLTSGLGCRFVVRGNDDRGALYSFYAFDWDNPEPKRAIASVELSTARKNGVATALFAIVANVPQGIAPAEEKPVSADLAEYGTEQTARKVDWITAVDFTRGMNKTRVITEGKYRAPLRHSIVADPGSPSGKALQIVMPPPVAGVKNPRLIVDVPAPKLAKLGSVRFSVRTDKPDLISRTGVYFMNANTVCHNVLFNFVNRKTDKWQSFEFPVYMLKPTAKGREVTPENFRTIRISAWMKNDYKGNITFRVGPVDVSNDEVDYVPPLRTFEVE